MPAHPGLLLALLDGKDRAQHLQGLRAEQEALAALRAQLGVTVHAFALWARRYDRRSKYAGNFPATDWVWWAFGPPLQALSAEDTALLTHLAQVVRHLQYVTASTEGGALHYRIGQLKLVPVGRRTSLELVPMTTHTVPLPEVQEGEAPPDLPLEALLQWVYVDRVVGAAGYEFTNVDGLVTHGLHTYAVEVKARTSPEAGWYVALRHTQHQTLVRLSEQVGLRSLMIVRSLQEDGTTRGWQVATTLTERTFDRLLYGLSRPLPTLDLAGLLRAQGEPSPDALAARARLPVLHPVFVTEHPQLSSPAPSRIWLRRVAYPSVRHAYLAAQTLDEKERAWVGSLDTSELDHVERSLTRRADWGVLEVQVALEVTRMKFRDPAARRALLETLPVELVGLEPAPLLDALKAVRVELAQEALAGAGKRPCATCTFARRAERPGVLGCDHFDGPRIPVLGLKADVPVSQGKASPLGTPERPRGEPRLMTIVPLHAAGCQFWRAPSSKAHRGRA